MLNPNLQIAKWANDGTYKEIIELGRNNKKFILTLYESQQIAISDGSACAVACAWDEKN